MPVSKTRFALPPAAFGLAISRAFLSRPTFNCRLNSRLEIWPGSLDAVHGQLRTDRPRQTFPSPHTGPLRSSIGLSWSTVSGLATLLLAVAYLVGNDQTRDPKSIYPPLSNSNDGLRLLVLLPGYWFQPVRCQLVSTTFSDNPQYEALSYAWGADARQASRSISVNGAQVKVGRNLWDALHHLRNSKEPRILWIDALCINQDNTDEKNKQIPLMLFIYSRARGVLIWLGTHFSALDMTKLTPTEYVAKLKHAKVMEEKQEIHEKLDNILNQMDSKFADIWKQLDALSRSRLGDSRGRLPEYSHVHKRQSKDTGSGPPDWAEAVSPFLSALIHEDYWRRTWIVQEFIVASKLAVFFGHSYLPWEDTSVIPWNDFLGWITYYNEMAPGDASVQFILNLSHMRRSRFGDTSKFTLASLVDAFKGSLCQHSHDKIYAFRGLAHDHIDDSLPVDYRKTLFEVYKDAIHFQNSASARDEVERAVEMVHFSALIYRLLTQDCSLAWQQHLRSLGLAPGSGAEDLDLGEKPRKLESQAHQSRPFGTSSLAGSFMAVLLEELDEVDDTNISPLTPDQRIALRGRAIRIKHIGPPLSELRASYTTTKRWASSIANHVQQSEQLEEARGLNNELLMTLAGHPGDMRPFVGAGGAIGLVPPNAFKGDLVCQFWSHDTCVVLRETVEWRPENGKHDVGYEVVGKSVLVSSVEGVDWEVAEDKTRFTRPAMDDGSWALDLRVDLADLMHLSLGAFGSWESTVTAKPLC